MCFHFTLYYWCISYSRSAVRILFFSHLGLSLEAQAAAVGLVVKLVVGVHDSAQVDAANLLRAALGLHVVEQSVNDATHSSFVF